MDRHIAIARDEQGRLHNTTGPALAYGDGWCIYAIHGVRVVNPDFIEDRTKLTVERIRAEQNAEVRRAMIGMFGAEKYLRDSGAVEIHKDNYGRLLCTEIPGDEPLVMVEVVNSTPEPINYAPSEGEAGEWRGSRWFKHYTLRVPPSMQRVREAVAWTFGLRESEYNPLVET